MENILKQLSSDEILDVILDTDAYNEIDDQFAIAYAMRSPEKINLLSINAAPFKNARAKSAKDGMEQSYNEIFKIVSLTDKNANIPVFRGSESFLESKKTCVESPAVDNIINTVKNSNKKIYILAIGAITNVASAIIKCPDIINNSVVVWLGGHSLHSPDTKEFNLKQDIIAAQVVFDSKIPLVHVPCGGVTTEFITTVPELEYYLRGKNELCDYLCDIVADFTKGQYARSKIVWDVVAIAALVKGEALSMVIIPTPIITSDYRYAFDMSRHHYIYVRSLSRDKIYGDLFKKLIN